MKSTEFKCLYHHVLVKLDDKEVMSKGGIIIPDAAEQTRHTGTIAFVGHGRLQPDQTLAPLMVEPGDKVLFGKYAGLPLTLDGVDYKHMREDEIIGIMYGEEKVDVEEPEY